MHNRMNAVYILCVKNHINCTEERSRKDGDKIHTKGGTKKINDLLTNRKISQLERNKVLLLLNQEEEVLAVLGYKI